MEEIFTQYPRKGRYHVKVIRTGMAQHVPPEAYPATIQIFSMEATAESEPLWQALSYDLTFIALPDVTFDVRMRLLFANGREVVSPSWPHSNSWWGYCS